MHGRSQRFAVYAGGGDRFDVGQILRAPGEQLHHDNRVERGNRNAFAHRGSAEPLLEHMQCITERDLATWLAEIAPAEQDDAVGHLAMVHAHPQWMVRAFADALGGDLAQTAEALAQRYDWIVLLWSFACALLGVAAFVIAWGAEPPAPVDPNNWTPPENSVSVDIQP